MLTYSLVDRGTVAITASSQTEDKAKFKGQYYTDKFRVFLLATVPR